MVCRSRGRSRSPVGLLMRVSSNVGVAESDTPRHPMSSSATFDQVQHPSTGAVRAGLPTGALPVMRHSPSVSVRSWWPLLPAAAVLPEGPFLMITLSYAGVAGDVHDAAPDFDCAVSLLAALEGSTGEEGHGEALPFLGMARAELVAFGQRRPADYVDVEINDFHARPCRARGAADRDADLLGGSPAHAARRRGPSTPPSGASPPPDDLARSWAVRLRRPLVVRSGTVDVASPLGDRTDTLSGPPRPARPGCVSVTVETYGEHAEDAARALNRLLQQDTIPADPTAVDPPGRSPAQAGAVVCGVTLIRPSGQPGGSRSAFASRLDYAGRPSTSGLSDPRHAPLLFPT